MVSFKKTPAFLFAAILFLAGCGKEPADYVNPFLGTGGHGHTFPGAIVPFGSVQVSPDTRMEGWDGCSGYHYSDSLIYGFSHTHLSGTGCSDYGDILVMPFHGKASLHNREYAAAFSHKNEKASPGYYSVKLDNHIKAELTAGRHMAMHRYTFPDKKEARGIIIDLTHRDQTLASGMSVTRNQIVGWRESSAWSPRQYCAFSLVASEPIEKIELYRNDTLQDVDEISGTNCKAIVYFSAKAKEVVLKVAISGTDSKGAVRNQNEIKGFDFKTAAKNARRLWNRELGRIEIENRDKTPVVNFYTALYHCYTAPYLYSDIDGRYRGMDGKIHRAEAGRQIYTVFSLWDTYRTLHPLLNIIDQKHTEDFIYTFLKDYEQGGALPVWKLSDYETGCMIGYHAVPVIYDAFVKGIGDYDKEKMLEAMVHSATMDKSGRPWYGEHGYITSEIDNESVSKTLEYAYDDWCIAQFAKAVGNDSIYKQFIVRAQSYKNLLDPQGFMHGKANGGWKMPFDPAEVNNNYTEANAWQYSTYVPHDIDNYVRMMGGKEAMNAFLDSLFFTKTVLSGRNQADITGMIGQYAHGNEPSHHAAYLYNYIGQPAKTQKLVRRIMTELYTDATDGLCGNEDCGQMSAWYVMSAMGFYPVCPGSNQYAIGCPMFDKVTVHLENGKDFVITKDSRKPFIQSAKLNGTVFAASYLTYHQIAAGGELSFTMGDRPGATWGRGENQCPSSKIENQIMPVPYFSTDKSRFADTDTIEILLPETLLSGTPEYGTLTGQARIYYTIDGSEPTAEKGLPYENPIVIDHDVTVKAVAVHPALGKSHTVEAQYVKFVKDKDVTYLTRPDPQYCAGGDDGLIDRVRGSANYRIGGWQGFLTDFEAVVDLRKSRAVERVGLGCLEDTRSWIFYPARVQVFVSADNVNFSAFGEPVVVPAATHEHAGLHDFVVSGNAQARYVKLKVTNSGALPGWHVSAGGQAWLFIDEIWIN